MKQLVTETLAQSINLFHKDYSGLQLMFHVTVCFDLLSSNMLHSLLYLLI